MLTVETTPYFGMFSDKGNEMVATLCLRAKMFGMSWNELHDAMRNMADLDPENYGEMMDTMVREMVYDHMGYTTDFYV